MSFDYLHLFGPAEKLDNGIFLFEIEHKRYIHMGDKIISFETDDVIEGYTVEHGYNDVKYPYACGKGNIYFMLHEKYILLKEYENSTKKTSITSCIEKMKN